MISPLRACIIALVLVSVHPAAAQLGPVTAISGGKPQARLGTLQLDTLARVENPFGLAVLPDGGVLVTEKPGRLRLFKNGSLSEPIAGLPNVAFRGQGGLLDVVLHPHFSENRLIYLSFAEPAADQPGGKDPCDTRLGPFCEKEDNTFKGLAIFRAKLDGGSLSDAKIIWRAVPKTMGRNHFGGRMAFAKDGSLFVTVGDRQRFEPAQDLRSDLGKIVHLTDEGSPAVGNPFAGDKGEQRNIWTLGHRNPTGIVIDPTGRIWVDEMGPLGGDEINLIEPGKNYGWPIVSDGDNYDSTPITRPVTRPEFERPQLYWNPSVSPSGLILYSGDLFKGWKGSLLAGGLSSQSIIRVVPAADGVHDAEVIAMGFRVRALAQSLDGSIFLLKDGADGALMRVTPASGGNGP